jgi:hypothetical protein
MSWRPALPFAVLAFAFMAPSAVWAGDATPRVTTDNAEYCDALAARLAASPQPVADGPRELGEEGRRLCANGHVRTGIAKLRRALRASRADMRGG